MIGLIVLRLENLKHFHKISAVPTDFVSNSDIDEGSIKKSLEQYIDFSGDSQYRNFQYNSYDIVCFFTGSNPEHTVGDIKWLFVLFLEKRDQFIGDGLWEAILEQWASELIPIYNYLDESESLLPKKEGNFNELDESVIHEMNFNEIVSDRYQELLEKVKIDFQVESQKGEPTEKTTSHEISKPVATSQEIPNLIFITRIEQLTNRLNKANEYATHLLDELGNTRKYVKKQANQINELEIQLVEQNCEMEETQAIDGDQKMTIEDKEHLLLEKNEKIAKLLVSVDEYEHNIIKLINERDNMAQQLITLKKENKVLQRDIINYKNILGLS